MLNSQRLLTAFAVFTAVGYGQNLQGDIFGLDGYASFPNQHQVDFIGIDSDVHELVFTSSWSSENDLTLDSGVLIPAAYRTPITGYFQPVGAVKHTDYIGQDYHIHDLSFDTVLGGNWVSKDLSHAAGAPSVAPWSPALASYVANPAEQTEQVHLDFIGTDNHVHEIETWSVTQARYSNDLTELAGAPNAATGSPLDAYPTPYNGQQHVDFIGTDNHVHELWYDGNWHHKDLTQATGAPLAKVQSLDGYITSYSNEQHVNFVGFDSHVHELWYDTAWHHNDLTQAAGVPPALAAAWSPLSGYETAFDSEQHVDFIDTNNHVHELYYASADGWNDVDLTQQLGSDPSQGQPLVGYVTLYDDQQHINYISSDFHLHEIWCSTQGGCHDTALIALTFYFVP